jgi:hypothetical protein
MVDSQIFAAEVRKAAHGHEYLGSSNIAQHFQLPLVSLDVNCSKSVPDSLSTIWKESMGDFMRDRIPDAPARSLRVEFDLQTPSLHRDGPRVGNVLPWYDADLEAGREFNRIEWWPRPAVLLCFQHERSHTINHH